MNTNLIIKTPRKESLSDSLKFLCGPLGLAKWEERQSSNYLEGIYFRSFSLGLKFTLATIDDSEFANYDVWLIIECEAACLQELAVLDPLADCIARKLASEDCDVVRPFNIGRAGSGGLRYRRNCHKESNLQDFVEVEEF